MYSIAILVIAALASISNAQFSGDGQQSAESPKQWFIDEQSLLDNQQEQPLYEALHETRRYKRSYGGSYQSKGGYGSSGSWGYENKLNQGYQNGLQRGMKCSALARTATDQWCYDNCLQGYCPKHVCACSGELYNRALKPTYSYGGGYGKSGQYQVKPSYGSQYQQALGSFGQTTYGQSNFGQSKYTGGQSSFGQGGSLGGFQQSGGLGSQQTSQQIEPQRFEQQTTEF